MKIKQMLLLGLMATAGVAAAALEPTVWADIPDVAPLRVGDTYYMTSTTMHFNPGIPVMASKDLVDWKIVSYCYDTIENRDDDRLDNGKNDYLYGTWASSIRHNEKDGYFYVSSFNNRARHTYLFRTKDPHRGDWERFVYTDKLVYDHSLWIEDGKFYFFGSHGGKVYLHKIKDDLSGIEPGEKLVCPDIRNNLRGGLAEGSQVFKRDGWYYLVNICWPPNHCRLVNVHRSRNLEGPYVEAKVCFEHEGIAQGSFIEKPDGSWVAVLFGDRGGVGRVPFVLPVKWQDGWPIVQPLDVYCGKRTGKAPGCVADDDFSAPKLKLEWQWNHNPDNRNWRLEDGKLKITTSRADKDLQTVKNVLTQRTFGPTCEATVKVDGSAMKVGDKAGLALFQHHWGAISLQKTERGYDVVVDQAPLKLGDRALFNPAKNAETREALRRHLGSGAVLHLKAVCDFTPFADQSYLRIPQSQDTGRFYYSQDGKNWTALGEAVVLPYTIPHFTGYRFGLFNWATREAGGTAAFDDYRTGYAKPGETMKMDGTNPIVKTRFSADPAGYVDGDWFYLFTGHDDPSATGYRMFDYTMCRTKDMRNWEDFGPVLNLAQVFPWARPDKAWASHVIRRGNKWYWYVATAHKHRRGDVIAVATADRPEGPWTDASGEQGLASGHGFIDPAVFVDTDGSAWIFWGNCGGNPGCWYGKLKDNMVELDGGYKPVPGLMDPNAFGEPLVKRCGAGVRRNGEKNTNFEEAPWIYKIGDVYYLEYAAGGVPENWSYSTAKSIHGPWTYRGKIMDNAGGTGTIHGGSVLFKGQWYMVYHDGNLPGGGDCRRSVCIEPYTRNSDGSIPFIKPTRKGVSQIGAPAVRKVSVELGDKTKGREVSKSMWGVFFEDINWGADGGLNPEMLANGGFDWLQPDHQNNPRDDVAWNRVQDGWEPDFRDGGMARMSFQYGAPVHPNTAKHLRIETFGTGLAGVRNRGLDGMWVQPGEPYRLSYDWREIELDGIDYKLGPWQRRVVEFTGGEAKARTLDAQRIFDVVLEPDGDRVTLSILVKGRRAVEFDNVSLQPTGPNLVRAGLRKDLVDKLDALKPAFVRFPGGCIVEQGDFQHWYDWRRTVGPKERRECIENRWARPGKPYWETFGVGFYEYFVLCEELGAEPMPICLAGITCQFQKPPVMCDVKDADYFAQVILELIEFANGGIDTKWGKVRAEMGHPKPFNLKMVGIGNENWNAEFFDRYEPIAKIVRQRHPEIKIVGSSGPFPHGREFDYAWGRIRKETADFVDEHYYRDPEWFLRSATRYDNYDRSKPPVYAGEYACHHVVNRGKPNTMWSAVCEAAAMTGFERNCDVVRMASYAPLFARLGHEQWAPNLIWFDGIKSWGTPNYYVQQLFSRNRPDATVPSTLKTDAADAAGKIPEFFQVAGYDRTAKEYVVKFVNAAEEACDLEIGFGRELPAGKAKITTVSGKPLDVNDDVNQLRCSPIETVVDFGGGDSLAVKLPPCSVSVIRVKD